MDGLYLGDLQAAQYKDLLLKAGITHILTVARDHPPLFPSFFTYKVVPVLDSAVANLKSRFPDCISFIKQAI